MRPDAAVVRWVLRALDLVLIALVLAGLATVILARIVPASGRTTLIVIGGSMEPTIPLGAVAIVGPTDPGTLRPGEVVSFKAPGAATMVTHRIVRTVQRSDGVWLETRGDANVAADPVLVPASTVVGRVEFAIPVAGRLMAAMARPGGVQVMFGLGGILLVSIWWLESLPRSSIRSRSASGSPRESAPADGRFVW